MTNHLAHRLTQAMTTLTRDDGTPWTDAKLADAIAAQGEPISRHHIAAIRKGTQPNPRQGLVEHIAQALQLPYRWFTPEDPTRQLLLQLLNDDTGVDHYRLRTLIACAAQLPEEDLDEIHGMATRRLAAHRANQAS